MTRLQEIEQANSSPEGWHDSLQEREQSATPSQQQEIDELNAAYAQPAISEKARNTTGSGGRSYKQAFQAIFKGNRKTSPIALILVLLFGGGGIFTAILAPGTTLLALADTLERDLNSQLSAMDKTSAQLWRTKLKQTTTGSCGAVVLRCKFKTINVDRFDKTLQLANATSSGHIQAEYDKNPGWGASRGKIKSMTWIDAAGNKEKIANAEAFTRLMKEKPEFRKTMLMVYNPRFSAFKTQTAIDFLAKNKTSYAKKLKGKTEEEVRESKTQAIKGESSIEVKKLRPVLDEDGNETGRYQDPETGREFSKAEADGLLEQERRIKASPPTSKVLATMATGASIVGIADSACTIFNMSRAVATGAKVIRQQEEIRYAMVYVNEAHAIRAEMSTPETVKVASDDIMHMEPKKQVVDESKLDSTPNGQPLPMIENPDGGKTGMDSPLYKMSTSQDYPKNLDAETQALLPGGGFTGTLTGVTTAVARAVGANDPQTISERCRVIQNPVVRTGALVIGVAAGIGSFGATTAFSMAGSTALALALPYLTSQLADMAAGNVTEGLKGMGAVSAIAIGTSAMFNGMARSNGLMPLSPEKMASYQNRKRETLVAYDELDKLAAKENPFDITNQFSFVGSLARTSLPITTQLRSGGMGFINSLTSITSLASTSIMPTSGAADARQTLVRPERYKICKDPDYDALGPNVAVDATCVMAFGMPDEGMEIDPEENLEWMIANDEIILGSDSGEPKDNDRDWNYKKYLEQCSKSQPGATEDHEVDPTNGTGCTTDENYEKNWHYAKFKVSLEVNLGIDQELPGMEGGSEDAFGDGSRGSIGLEGWAYPTDKEKTQFTSGFGQRWGSMHNGADLAGPLGTPIYAARDGEVVLAGPMSGFGNLIVLRHEVDGKRVDTAYGHMSQSGVLVKRGDKVTAGQMIGRIGSEGFSTGPHLHFEVWDGGSSYVQASGKAIDPKPILDKAAQSNPSSSGGNE